MSRSSCLQCFVLSCSVFAFAMGCSPTSNEPTTDQGSAELGAAENGAAAFAWPVPKGWSPESYSFPLPWAGELAYRGIEEIRWTPHPFNPSSETYFSYSYVWLLEDATPFTKEQLAADLTVYYRGLSRTFDEAHFDPTLHRSEITALEDGSYTGVVETVDPFNGSRPLKLHVEGENVTCGAQRGFIVSLSPHTPGDAVWKALSSNRHTFACTK